MRLWPLVLLLLLASCRPGASPTIQVDSTLASLVSPDTVMLAGIRVEPIRSTPLYKQYVANRKSIPALDEFVRETGLDPRRDVQEVLAASDGNDIAVLAKGRFSRNELEAKLEREGAKRLGYKSYTLLGDEPGAVVFLDSSTAVAAPARVLRAVIDLRDRKRGGIPASLLAKVNAISSNNQIWFAGNVAGQLPRLDFGSSGNLANLNNLTRGLESVTASVDLRNGIDAQAVAASATEQDAKMLNNTLRGLVGLGRLSTPENRRDLLRLYDGIAVSHDKKTVTAGAKIPADLLDEVIRLLDRGTRDAPVAKLDVGGYK